MKHSGSQNVSPFRVSGFKMFSFTKYSKYYYIFSGILIIASIGALTVFGLRLGIEFTGGSNLEVEFSEAKPDNREIIQALVEFNLGEITAQSVGENGAMLRFREVDENIHRQIVVKLKESFLAEERSFEHVGPLIGGELKKTTIGTITLTLIIITLYIAFAFRKVSKPVSSWKYGAASLIALFHDIIIPLGIFAALGKFYNVEITIPIIAALLTVLGFSVHDTIVIFDRIRENLLKHRGDSFESTVDISLNQTLGRSIGTTATTLVVVTMLFLFGGYTLKYFSLALIIGISSGAYSSIFVAAPLLASWRQRKA